LLTHPVYIYIYIYIYTRGNARGFVRLSPKREGGVFDCRIEKNNRRRIGKRKSGKKKRGKEVEKLRSNGVVSMKNRLYEQNSI